MARQALTSPLTSRCSLIDKLGKGGYEGRSPIINLQRGAQAPSATRCGLAIKPETESLLSAPSELSGIEQIVTCLLGNQ